MWRLQRLVCRVFGHRWGKAGRGTEVCVRTACRGRADAIRQDPTLVAIAEHGRQLAASREDLIARGVDPASLLVPLYPADLEVWHDEVARWEQTGRLDRGPCECPDCTARRAR